MKRNIRKITRNRDGKSKVNYRGDQEVSTEDEDDPIEIEGLGDLSDIEKPLKEKEVLHKLYYSFGLTKKEIAEELDCSKVAVSMQMNKFEIGQ
ncbi:hypothetical protein [Natrinema versiforme]|uniref:Uncharacterized protein n=1 Tax=Natrinema versiforme TaxID=88724 RepID=A0A4P8WLQ1_9EURY|nr:hypothetical protein [Natrinema versiforme]QCS42871.1 hypothetical protein FEJ81_11065 [Natrinema versiforme]